jgi:alpha-1,2-mannosyltransferase
MTAGPRVNPVLAAGATAFALSVAVLGSEVAIHGKSMMTWFDLRIYYHAGLLARHTPGALYRWQAQPGDGFTYTPFAAVLFAAMSTLPLVAVRWLMTTAGVAGLLATVWLTARALGWSDRRRAGLALTLAAGLLWSEPVLKALKLGQVELLLMALVVWDLTQPDERRLKGVGIGLAAAIKLVPLIFIAYLALCGNVRAAARGMIAFAVAAAVGFVALPGPSEIWWLHGYLFHAARDVSVGAFANQSLLGLLSRIAGSVSAATPAWIICSTVVFAAGLASAVRLHRNGWTVAGWLVCGLTALLVSPISWDHHWVWIVLMVVLGAHLSLRGPPRVRRVAGVATGLVTVIFFGWPGYLGGPHALIPGGGVFALLARTHGARPLNPYGLHAWQLGPWDLFVLTGVALLGVGATVARELVRGQDPRRRPRLPGVHIFHAIPDARSHGVLWRR